MSTGAKPEFDPKTLADYIAQIRAADPSTPIGELNDYVRQVSGGTFANVATLTRATRGPASAPADATGMFSIQNEDAARRGAVTLTGRNVGRSALRGLTFNLDDNIARGLNVGTAPGGMYSPEGEANFRQYQQDHPLMDLAAGVVGGAPVPLGMFGKVAKGAGLMQRVKAGAQIGGVAGALAGAGDAESPTNNAVERVKGGLFGAAFGAAGGAALPLAGAGMAAAGRKGRAVVDGAYAGRRDLLSAAERLGDIGPDGLPTGKNAPWWDDAGRARNLGIGMRRLGQRMNDFVVADRAPITPVAALAPEFETMAVNTVRNNPGTAASGAVQGVAEMGGGMAARTKADAELLRTATGRNASPVAPADPATVTRRMADEALSRMPGPKVPSPTARNGLVGTPTRNAAERIELMRTNLQTWAAGPEGFGGLRAMPVQPLTKEMAPHVKAIDNIVMSVGDKRAADAAANVSNIVRQLGEPGFGVDDARLAMTSINDIMEKGFPVDGGKPIALTTKQLETFGAARTAIQQAVDAQTGKQFTPTMRAYAQRNRLIEGVELGRDLYAKRASLTPQDMEQEIARLSKDFPEVRKEVYEGMLSDLVSGMRSAKGENIVQTLVKAARSEDNQKIAAMFPGQKAFQDWMMRAYTQKAGAEGVQFFTNTSVAELSALMRAMDRTATNAAERAAVKKAFTDGMYSRMMDQLNNPEQAETLVRQFADAGNAQMRVKARMLFGKRGGDEFLRRSGLEGSLSDFSNRVKVAARTPSNIGDVRGEQAQIGGRNPISARGFSLGAIRTALAPGHGRKASSAIADVLFAPGEQGMRKLTDLYQRDAASRAIRYPGLLPAIGGQLGGRVGNGLMSILNPSPTEP